jgi:hypothetical protein
MCATVLDVSLSRHAVAHRVRSYNGLRIRTSRRG